MKKYAPIFARIGAALSIIWSLIVLYLTYKELTEPVSRNEFEALNNFARGVSCLLLVGVQLAILIISFFVFGFRKGAWITLMILILLASLILPFSGVQGVVFELQAGAPISVVNEISPALIGLLLILSWPVYFRKK